MADYQMTHADLYQILIEAEERVKDASDEGVRERSAETVSLCLERLKNEGLTREQLKKLAAA
jgi:hypothetical protein